MGNTKRVVYTAELIGTPFECIITHSKRDSRSGRIARIAVALKYASEEDVAIVERVLDIRRAF